MFSILFDFFLNSKEEEKLDTSFSLTHLPVGGAAHAGVGAAEEVGEEGVCPVLVHSADCVEEGGVGRCSRVPAECTSSVPLV